MKDQTEANYVYIRNKNNQYEIYNWIDFGCIGNKYT